MPLSYYLLHTVCFVLLLIVQDTEYSKYTAPVFIITSYLLLLLSVVLLLYMFSQYHN